jgi:hypothetical protein
MSAHVTQKKEIKVRVPAAVAAGQQVAFTTPDGQHLAVRVQEALDAGTVLVVHYKPVEQEAVIQVAAAAAPPQAEVLRTMESSAMPVLTVESEQPSAPAVPVCVAANVISPLPASVAVSAQAVRHTPYVANGILTQPSVVADQERSVNLLPEATVTGEEADRRAMKISLALLGVGYCCHFIFAPIGFIILVICASMYFCKSSQQRTQFPRQRRVAFTCLFLCLVWVVLFVLRHRHRFHYGHHHRHHHSSGHAARAAEPSSFDYDYDDYYDADGEDALDSSEFSTQI